MALDSVPDMPLSLSTVTLKRSYEPPELLFDAQACSGEADPISLGSPQTVGTSQRIGSTCPLFPTTLITCTQRLEYRSC